MQHSEHEESLTTTMSEGCSCIANASLLHWVVSTATHSEADVMPAHIANANNYLQTMQRKIRQIMQYFWRKWEKKPKKPQERIQNQRPPKHLNLFRIRDFMNIVIVTFHNYMYEKQDTQIQYLAKKWSSGLKDFRITEIFSWIYS